MIKRSFSRVVDDVGRKGTPEEILQSGFNWNTELMGIERYVVSTMPKRRGRKVTLHFFNVGRKISPEDLEKEYKRRGLKPDPYAQAKLNSEDKLLASKYPNLCQWRVLCGRPKRHEVYYLAFDYVKFGRNVRKRRVTAFEMSSATWGKDWWVAGVRVNNS